MIKGNGFPKKARLAKRIEFLKIRNGAAVHVGILAIVETKANTLGHCRLGITASRKFGKAVIRNRFKRAVREAFRHFDWRSFSFDIHVRPRAKAHDIQGSFIMEEVYSTLTKVINGRS